MKYILLFVEDERAAEQVPAAERDAVYKEIADWFARHGQSGKIVGGEELQPRHTAKTVRFAGRGGAPTVTDGPYMEAKELVGGYAILDVASEQEAVELAKSWPGRSIVELRPLVDHSGGQ